MTIPTGWTNPGHQEAEGGHCPRGIWPRSLSVFFGTPSMLRFETLSNSSVGNASSCLDWLASALTMKAAMCPGCLRAHMG